MTETENERRICREWGLGIKHEDGSYSLGDKDGTIFDLVCNLEDLQKENNILKINLEEKNQRIQNLLIENESLKNGRN